MSLEADALKRYIERRPDIRCYIESGTFAGDSVQLAQDSGQFETTITIELSLELWKKAEIRFRNTPVLCIYGDSSRVMPILARTIKQPALFYLDGHWYNADEAAKENPLPLFDELEAIAKRPHRDLVVIDDARRFGTAGPTADWLNATPENFLKILGNEWSGSVIGNHWVGERQ